jgi:hypothetical protein
MRAATTARMMKAIGIGPTLALRNETKPPLIAPWAVGLNVRETPSRMLIVARVAMIDGIFTPRMSPALTRPNTRPQRRTTPTPWRIPAPVALVAMRYEPMTTPRLIIAPTERSR